MNNWVSKNLKKHLGKKIDFWGDQYTIEGVTENFHQQSLREAYEPLILRLIPDVNGSISIKTSAAQASQTINIVKAEWNKFFPGNTFEYFFLDDHFDEQYKADQRFGQVFSFIYKPCNIGCLSWIIWSCIIHHITDEQKKLASVKYWVLQLTTY